MQALLQTVADVLNGTFLQRTERDERAFQRQMEAVRREQEEAFADRDRTGDLVCPPTHELGDGLRVIDEAGTITPEQWNALMDHVLPPEGSFRAKPVVINAVRWLPPSPAEGLDSYYLALEAIEQWCEDQGVHTRCRWVGDVIRIQTSEGTVCCEPGDWLAVGVEGEVYPVKHSAFVKTYEVA